MIPDASVQVVPLFPVPIPGAFSTAFSAAYNGPGGPPVHDVSCFVDQVAIRHGRQGTEGQPEASTVTIDASLDTSEDHLTVGLDIGAEVTVFAYLPGMTGLGVCRFKGRVTDITAEWEDRGPDTPNALVVQVIAAGPLAELGRRVLPGPWGRLAELDGPRVFAIVNEVPGVVPTGTFDPGTVELIPMTFPTATPAALVAPAVASGRGVLWETREGLVEYADANHRRGTPAALSLDACDLLVSPQWLRDTEGLVNAVTLAYGETPVGGGDRPVHTAEDTESQDRYGFHDYSAETQLSREVDAVVMADVLLTQNTDPAWLLDALPVDVAGLDAATSAAILALDMHSLIHVTDLPAAGSAPRMADMFVEGWEEQFRFGEWELTLNVSDYSRTAPSMSWHDVDPALTWDAVDAGVTWDTAGDMTPAVLEEMAHG